MTEMSVALCPFSPWLIDMGGPQETSCWGHACLQSMEEVHLDGNPLQVSLGRQLVLSLSEPRGQRGGGGELGPESR